MSGSVPVLLWLHRESLEQPQQEELLRYLWSPLLLLQSVTSISPFNNKPQAQRTEVPRPQSCSESRVLPRCPQQASLFGEGG